jgi:hypothetical protein
MQYQLVAQARKYFCRHRTGLVDMLKTPAISRSITSLFSAQ